MDINGRDEYFAEIGPSAGIHDIHMNQGNKPGKFFKDNDIYQDGGLVFYFVSRNRCAAAFTAFKSQSFYTNDVHGNPLNDLLLPDPHQP